MTDQGVSLLSSVLKSKKAIQINITIIDAFISLKEYALSHADLSSKLKQLETKYDKQFDDVFEAINYLLKKVTHENQAKNRDEIGYKK